MCIVLIKNRMIALTCNHVVRGDYDVSVKSHPTVALSRQDSVEFYRHTRS